MNARACVERRLQYNGRSGFPFRWQPDIRRVAVARRLKEQETAFGLGLQERETRSVELAASAGGTHALWCLRASIATGPPLPRSGGIGWWGAGRPSSLRAFPGVRVSPPPREGGPPVSGVRAAGGGREWDAPPRTEPAPRCPFCWSPPSPEPEGHIAPPLSASRLWPPVAHCREREVAERRLTVLCCVKRAELTARRKLAEPASEAPGRASSGAAWISPQQLIRHPRWL
ncbi:hypothetical protein COCON_G00175080 [Conger conger]|uniref:Uncharacterized protein n=1 Tax=Conger conger TaxID=82655 RepID=A0A9Q1D4J6_CONCO|nr:hypothetical protein COCON_G00175080 [Conger conger]